MVAHDGIPIITDINIKLMANVAGSFIRWPPKVGIAARHLTKVEAVHRDCRIDGGVVGDTTPVALFNHSPSSRCVFR